ncbi:hypothetical protein ADL19_21670 [Streptomyces purpurogeneiscleroticus]|nr:hypothetical protein ADL19_21670 [Streptomyces purpurogeneiscleroticus]
MKQLELFPATTPDANRLRAEIQALDEMTDRERAAALRRHRYVRAVEDLPPGRRGDHHLRAAIRAVSELSDDVDPPTPRQVRTWEARLREADGNPAGLVDRRMARSLRQQTRWAPWIGELVDRVVSEASLHRGVTLTAVAQLAQARCLEAAHAQECAPGDVPGFRTLVRMVGDRLRPLKDAYRFRHLSCGRPLAEVVVAREVLRLAIPELGADRVHLVTARDIYSGVIVAAALGTAPPDGEDLLGLFGARTATAAPEPLGAARLCMGLPEVIVLDRDPAFHGATFRQSAAALGIRLHFAAVDHPGAPCRVAGLQRWLTVRGEVVEDAGGLMAAAHAWLADLDVRRSGPDRWTPLDRWQDGVARYPIRLSPGAAPAIPTGEESGGADEAEGPDGRDARRRP